MRHMLHQCRLCLFCLALLLLTNQCGDDEPQHDPTGTGDGLAATSGAGAVELAGAAAGPDGKANGSTAAPSVGMGGGGASIKAGDGGSSGTAGAMNVPPPDDGMPTWSGIYNHTFYSCKNAVCHGKGVAGVDMTSQQSAYDSLVGQTSDPTRDCAMLNLKRVEPGEPERSLLYLKLDIAAPCGQQMPPGGTVPQKVRDRVRDWIMLGAKND
jgi:hypothetical protein